MEVFQDWDARTKSPALVRREVRRWIAADLLSDPEATIGSAHIIQIDSTLWVPGVWIGEVVVAFDLLGSPDPSMAHIYSIDALYDFV